MATSGMKRYFISNTSCLSNLYLIECFRKCKSKTYLKAILMIVEKGLSVTKKETRLSQNENVQRSSSKNGEN